VKTERRLVLPVLGGAFRWERLAQKRDPPEVVDDGPRAFPHVDDAPA
jgi:hypothetical protein